MAIGDDEPDLAVHHERVTRLRSPVEIGLGAPGIDAQRPFLQRQNRRVPAVDIPKLESELVAAIERHRPPDRTVETQLDRAAFRVSEEERPGRSFVRFAVKSASGGRNGRAADMIGTSTLAGRRAFGLP